MNEGSRNILMNEWLNKWKTRAACYLILYILSTWPLPVKWIHDWSCSLCAEYHGAHFTVKQMQKMQMGKESTHPTIYISLRHYQLIQFWNDLLKAYLRHQALRFCPLKPVLYFETTAIIWDNFPNMWKAWVGNQKMDLEQVYFHHS